MIEFDKFTLKNGLRVIVHRDETTPMAAVNILYNIGAKDENPERTGFAHLFEHLMFGGSINIPNYDEPLQMVGGDNNAWTNNDITNYYLTVPKANLETAFWLESDRMLSLAFSEKSLEVQRSVVIEEFKQRYFNQPYGDVWLHLRPLAYKEHPYQWPTIGKSIDHIEKATLEEVKDFFFHHYAPNNAIMVVAGNVDTQQVKELSEKWFGPIERREIQERNLPVEPTQNEFRSKRIDSNVPFDAIYMAFHMGKRMDEDFYIIDLVSDVLSNGQSSRIFQSLVKEKNLFSSIDAYITGEFEPGLFLITGKLIEGVAMETAEAAIWEELNKMATTKVDEYELQKVKNKVESSLVFSEISYLNKAMNLATHELLGDADDINKEVEKYQKVSVADILNSSAKIFRKENCSTLYYYSKK
ncbi:M16 family metallopeptidase [Labilibaculum euxinus]|uniref:Insulinase family protein n=1 Tax=Labilibaculum euxinus TaxID=2686357 RepID=A0A7M4D474_9BACT|nr:pitrilysin family protein [Labilibaculum euxinus]MUP37453.1 insulinase family protein [Labilibaculum euxinus]MVB06658.1 insulinase family protein [Labilibaculum euxinus]